VLRAGCEGRATGRQHARLGDDQIGSVYGGLFENSPSLHAEIRNRIDVGSVVIDEEVVTGFVLPGMPTELHAAVVYHVANGLIQGAQLVG